MGSKSAKGRRIEEDEDLEEEEEGGGSSKTRTLIIGAILVALVFFGLPKLKNINLPISGTVDGQSQAQSIQQPPQNGIQSGGGQTGGQVVVAPTVVPVTDSGSAFSDEAIQQQVQALEKAGKTSIDGLQVIPITPPPVDKAKEAIGQSLNGAVFNGVKLIEVNGYYPLAGVLQYKSCAGTPLGTKIPEYPGMLLVCTQCANIQNPVWATSSNTIGYQVACPLREGQ